MEVSFQLPGKPYQVLDPEARAMGTSTACSPIVEGTGFGGFSGEPDADLPFFRATQVSKHLLVRMFFLLLGGGACFAKSVKTTKLAKDTLAAWLLALGECLKQCIQPYDRLPIATKHQDWSSGCLFSMAMCQAMG